MVFKINKAQAQKILDLIYDWSEDDLESIGEDYAEGYASGARDFLKALGTTEEELKKFIKQ